MHYIRFYKNMSYNNWTMAELKKYYRLLLENVKKYKDIRLLTLSTKVRKIIKAKGGDTR